MDTICPHDDADFGAQSVAYTGTAGNTTGWKSGPRGVWLYSTTDCYARVGEGVTATTAGIPLPAYTPVILRVPFGTGATWRVSAIQVATGGTMYAKPVQGD